MTEDTFRRVLILGNSGSGKSTLAKSISESSGLAHLDLDVVAWLPSNPPKLKSLDDCTEEIRQFMSSHEKWVIEGCYANLIEIAAGNATEMIFLNLPIGECVSNARVREWEPHKYKTKEAQDENLPFLVDWIRTYSERDDECSFQSHLELFERFARKKTMRTTGCNSEQYAE